MMYGKIGKKMVKCIGKITESHHLYSFLSFYCTALIVCQIEQKYNLF